MSFQVAKHNTVRSFLATSEQWLLKAEAENNLVIGIARRLMESGDHGDSLFVTAESEGYVVGCAFRTPPFKLGLTRMPLKAVPPLVEAVSEEYETLPGVLGPKEEARYFSRMWCGPRALSFRPVMDQRIYALEELNEPASWPAGELRTVVDADLPLVTEWLRRFFEETHMPVTNAQEVANKLLPEGLMSFWTVDGVEVSMAGITAETPNGARIGFVYTPAEERKKGYGTAITAALTRRMLETGKRRCFLFTDASNQTSNGIYQGLGYYPVADVVDYQFF